MFISRTGHRIPQTEWEAHKPRLIELYLDRRLQLTGPNGVIETMVNEGFIATKAQYEHQFRTWNVRKNMKRHEYERIIQERQQGGGPTPITLEGRVISKARSKRALRRYARGMPQANGSVSREDAGVTWGDAATLTPSGGRGTPAENPAPEAITQTTEHDNGAGNMSTHPDIGPIAIGQYEPLLELTHESIGMSSHDSNDVFGFHMDFDYQMSFVDFNLPALHADGPLPDGVSVPAMDVVAAQHHQMMSPRLTGALFDMEIEPTRYPSYAMAFESPGALNVPHSHEQIFQRNQWIPPSAAITATLVKDICDTCGTASARDTVLNLRNLSNNFVDDLQNVEVLNPPTDFTLALRTLFSTETLFGEDFTKIPNDVAIDVATEAHLYGRLTTSAINGFTGLGNIPASGVMVFLNKHRTTALLMIQFLASNPSPAAKSLTENIFRSALEHDNVSVVKFLLDHSKSVHANETVCLFHGERYTPLEVATAVQSYSVIGLLIERNVDVNKTFSRGDHGNALSLLLSNRGSRSTVDDRFFSLVSRFLSAGATVSADSIREQLCRSLDQRLTIPLLESSTSQVLKQLISNKATLRYIVTGFEKPNAQNIMKLIVERCRRIDANLCWHYSLLLEIVEQDYEELAKTLVHRASSSSRVVQTASGTMVRRASSSSKVFRTARKAKTQAIIDLALHKCPADDEGGEPPNIIRTLLDVLRSGDQGYLLTLAKNEVLKQLTCSELSQAFTTALQEGNLRFASRILDFDPAFCFANNSDFDPTVALSAAFAHDFDGIAWKLTAFSFTTTEYGGRRKRFSPLKLAVEKRKPDFVRVLIECGHPSNWPSGPFDNEWSVIKAAVEWGDDPIIRDLWERRPHPIPPKRDLMEFLLKKGQMYLFWNIFEAWNTSPACVEGREWVGAVEIAIKREDLQLLDELIAQGASLTYGDLTVAISLHSSITKPFLERYRQVYPQGCTECGRDVIESEIDGSPESSELMDLFFEFNLVTEDILQKVIQGDITLLAEAIGRSKCYPEKEHPKKRLIKRLLDAGSEVNIPVDDGSGGDGHPTKTTALLLAIETVNAEIVQLLIEGGAEVNKPARFGVMCTPLQKAAELNNFEIATLLLENGAEVNAPPDVFYGATALQFAAIHGNCQLAMTLLEHGARLDVAPSRGPGGRWPLEGAAENGRLDMIQLLWDANNGPFDDKQCQKAMRLAEYYGHLGCRDLIKELMAESPIEF